MRYAYGGKLCKLAEYDSALLTCHVNDALCLCAHLVNKQVFATAFGSDEPEAFRGIEPTEDAI